MGNSIAAATIRNSDDMLKCIREFLALACGTEKYLLAAESYGGYLARALSIHDRENLLGLFMLCPLLFPGARQGRVHGKVVLVKDTEFLESLSETARKEFEYLAVIQTKEIWEDYKQDIRLGTLPENKGFLERRLYGAFSAAVPMENRQFEKPTLILVGRQDSEVGFEDQLELYKDYPRATISVLDLSGHNLQIERKELFVAFFLDWLDRVESFGSAT